MKPRARKTLLFLDADDSPRGRAAETEFNAVAGRMGLPWVAVCRDPATADVAELSAADHLVALEAGGLADRTPEQAARAESWSAVDAGGVGKAVAGLVARFLGGRVLPDAPVPTAAPEARPAPTRKLATVRVGRETKGRRGSGVTVVWDVPVGEAGLRELAATLKQRCGTGGTVKDGRIEIQGDQRERLTAELERLGYKVKHVGG